MQKSLPDFISFWSNQFEISCHNALVNFLKLANKPIHKLNEDHPSQDLDVLINKDVNI
jgi:hypothetical protein